MLQKKEYQAKIPATPTKPNVTKEGIPTTQRYQQHRQNLMLQNKSYQQQQ